MLLCCLELKDTIKRFIQHLRNNDSIDDDLDYNPLTNGPKDNEWDNVKELVDFLEAPYEMTKCLKGNNCSSGFGSLWQTLPNLQALWAHYSAADVTGSGYFSSAIALGLKKLNTYFDLILMAPNVSFYAVATTLHPWLRLNWFKSQWKHYPQWYSKAEKSIRKVFKQYVDDEVDLEESQSSRFEPPSRRKVPGGGTGDDLFILTMAVDLHLLTNAKNKRVKRVSQVDEYFDALLMDCTNASNDDLELLEKPWLWWLQHRNRYPILFKVATNYLSIPSMSCECERAFSKAGRTIMCDCNSLHSDTIEALQLQRNWVQHGLVKSSLKDVKAYMQNINKKRQQQAITWPTTATASSLGQSQLTYCP
jgi:hypothetical protein